MRFSVIIPVYNEEEAVAQCLDALLKQDYPKEDFEVIVVNDGSTDGTKDAVKTYPVTLVTLEKNMGRIVARETGARAANSDLLLFVDSRYIIQGKDFLKKVVEVGYQPIFPVAIEEKYGSPFNTLFYLMRKKWYKPYYPFDNYPREFWIDEETFGNVPKGLSVLLIDRGLFLSSIPAEKGKLVNDDTRLLREVVKRKKILRHSDVKVAYLQRTGSREVMRHIYERGPRFADCYLTDGGKHKAIYSPLLVCAILFILSGAFYPKVFYYAPVVLLTINSIAAIYIAEDLKDFFIVFFLLPLIAGAFFLGVLKWQIRWGNGEIK